MVGTWRCPPPVTVGGIEHPFGRPIVGTNTSADLRDFLVAQRVQGAPLQLNVNWLNVGHVDEVICVVDADTILLADPGLGNEVLDAVPDCEPMFYDGDREFRDVDDCGDDWLQADGAGWDAGKWADGAVLIYGPRWQTHWVQSNEADRLVIEGTWNPPIQTGDQFVVVEISKKQRDGRPALTTVAKTLAEHGAFNAQLKTDHIDAIEQTLPDELGLGIVHVPATFRAGYPTDAFVPGMVNLQVVNGALLVPDPFGPHDAEDHDAYKESFLRQTGAGASAHWIDDFYWYHALQGESHCGTNAKRRCPDDWDWWTHW
jgi:hypothetical protein